MAIPTQYEMGVPILELLSDGKSLHYDQIEKKMAKHFELTKEEKKITKSSGNERLLHNRIRWSIFYLVKVGLVERPKPAHAKITKNGGNFLKTNPERINYSILTKASKFPDWIESLKK